MTADLVYTDTFTLYHFTSRHALNMILRDDAILPRLDESLGMHVVWCTTRWSKSNAFNDGVFGDFNDPRDRNAVRFALEIPRSVALFSPQDSSRGTLTDPEEDWFFILQPIPRAEWREISDVYTGQLFLTSDHARMTYMKPPEISTREEQLRAAAAQDEWMREQRAKFSGIDRDAEA